MTTPGQWNRLNHAAELYSMHFEVTEMLCTAIKRLHGGIQLENEITSEEDRAMFEVANKVATAVEQAFHHVLDPYVLKLEEISQSIKANLPKPPGSIVLPGDVN